jgi:hypothetical protein
MDAEAGVELNTAENTPKEAATGSRRPTVSASRPATLLLRPGASARENSFMPGLLDFSTRRSFEHLGHLHQPLSCSTAERPVM